MLYSMVMELIVSNHKLLSTKLHIWLPGNGMRIKILLLPPNQKLLALLSDRYQKNLGWCDFYEKHSNLSFYIPDFNNCFRRASPKNESIGMKSSCCVSTFTWSLTNLQMHCIVTLTKMQTTMCVKESNLSKALSRCKITKTPRVIQRSRNKIFLGSMDSYSLHL